MFSRVSGPVVDSAGDYERREDGNDDVRYTTRLQFIFTERALVFTLMGSLAAMVSVMHTTIDAE
jgi:hypothetical protein